MGNRTVATAPGEPTIHIKLTPEEEKARKVEEEGFRVADAKVAYAAKRKIAYGTIEDQLDFIYHNGLTKWKTKTRAIKEQFPKPDEAS